MNSWRVGGMRCSACVLYDVALSWSPLGLRCPVPELSAVLQPQGALQGGLHVVLVVESSCMSLELGSFTFMWVFTAVT